MSACARDTYPPEPSEPSHDKEPYLVEILAPELRGFCMLMPEAGAIRSSLVVC